MDFTFRFDRWFEKLAPSPRDTGRVEHCVVRPKNGERLMPAQIRVSPDAGIEGDRWITDEHRGPGNQVSLINVHVLRSLAGGDAARMALSGDNLIVDLDLSEANLPVGTRLSIGRALLEISPDSHRPCHLFHARFGAEGAKKVRRANRVGRRGRGVLARIVREGTIAIGDAILVERPGAAVP